MNIKYFRCLEQTAVVFRGLGQNCGPSGKALPQRIFEFDSSKTLREFLWLSSLTTAFVYETTFPSKTFRKVAVRSVSKENRK